MTGIEGALTTSAAGQGIVLLLLLIKAIFADR
jgi:hypothetical protein